MIEFILFGVLSLMLIISSGIAEAFMDKLQFHWEKSIFVPNPPKYKPSFWNPAISWKNKWKEGTDYKVEKFKGSTSIFVFTTDAWHLFKFIKNTTMFLAIFFAMVAVTFNPFIPIIYLISLVILARTSYGLAFTLFFNHILHYVDPFLYIKNRRPGGGKANNQI